MGPVLNAAFLACVMYITERMERIGADKTFAPLDSPTGGLQMCRTPVAPPLGLPGREV